MNIQALAEVIENSMDEMLRKVHEFNQEYTITDVENMFTDLQTLCRDFDFFTANYSELIPILAEQDVENFVIHKIEKSDRRDYFDDLAPAMMGRKTA